MYVHCLRHMYNVHGVMFMYWGNGDRSKGPMVVAFSLLRVVLHAFYILIHPWIWNLELY